MIKRNLFTALCCVAVSVINVTEVRCRPDDNSSGPISSDEFKLKERKFLRQLRQRALAVKRISPGEGSAGQTFEIQATTASSNMKADITAEAPLILRQLMQHIKCWTEMGEVATTLTPTLAQNPELNSMLTVAQTEIYKTCLSLALGLTSKQAMAVSDQLIAEREQNKEDIHDYVRRESVIAWKTLINRETASILSNWPKNNARVMNVKIVKSDNNKCSDAPISTPLLRDKHKANLLQLKQNVQNTVRNAPEITRSDTLYSLYSLSNNIDQIEQSLERVYPVNAELSASDKKSYMDCWHTLLKNVQETNVTQIASESLEKNLTITRDHILKTTLLLALGLISQKQMEDTERLIAKDSRMQTDILAQYMGLQLNIALETLTEQNIK